jgi:hypothetical protein
MPLCAARARFSGNQFKQRKRHFCEIHAPHTINLSGATIISGAPMNKKSSRAERNKISPFSAT